MASCADLIAQHWSEARDGTRHQLDHMVENRWPAFDIEIVRARLAASEGDPGAAHSRLVALAALPQDQGWPAFETFVATCLYCGSFATAQRAIAARFPALASLRLALDEDPASTTSRASAGW